MDKVTGSDPVDGSSILSERAILHLISLIKKVIVRLPFYYPNFISTTFSGVSRLTTSVNN